MASPTGYVRGNIMAGGGGTYTVGSGGYASIAAAMSQLIADEDGNPFSTSQTILLTQDSTEVGSLALPTIGQAYGTSKNPLIIRGDTSSPRRKWIRTTSNGIFVTISALASDVICGIEFRDIEFNYTGTGTVASCVGIINNGQNFPHLFRRCEWTSSSGLLGSIVNGRYGYNADFVDCIMRSNSLRAGAVSSWGDYILYGCRVYFSGAGPLISAGPASPSFSVKAINSALRLGGPIATNTSQLFHVGIDFRQCTILFDTASYFTTIQTAATNQQQIAWPMIRNCILHNARGLRQDVTDMGDVRILNPFPSGYNIWSALSGGNSFIDYPTSSFDIVTLADAQAFGLEEGSTTHAGVTFLSTTVTDPTFLMVSGLNNDKRNCGIYRDAFGTDRSAIFVSAGHYQETPRTLDLTTTTGGGNSIVPAAGDVLLNVPVGTTLGSFDEASRNVGVAADKVLVGNSIKIQNVTTNGSFDEAARNVGVSADKLLIGNSIKIQNVVTNGSFDEEARNTIIDEDDVLAGVNYKTRNVNYQGNLTLNVVPTEIRPESNKR
jgi:hypothetical protein